MGCLTEAWSDNMKLLAVLSLALLGVVLADAEAEAEATPVADADPFFLGRRHVRYHGHGYGHHRGYGYGHYGYYGKRSADAKATPFAEATAVADPDPFFLGRRRVHYLGYSYGHHR